MNAEITAIGSVSPVMIVLRQLCRKRKTIAIVSKRAFDERLLDAAERARDPVAVGVDEAQLDAGRQGLAQLLGRGLDRLAGLDDVRVLLLEDLERDRRHAVVARDRLGLALALDQRAEVGEADHRVVAGRDDDVGERLGVLDPAFDADDRVLLAAAEEPDRQVGVGALQRGRDVGRRQLHRAQPLRIEVDPDLAHRQAGDVDAGDAGRALEALPDDLVGDAATARARCGRGREARDRPSAARCRRRSARRTAAWRRAGSWAAPRRPCRARPARRGSCRPRAGTRPPSRCAPRGCSSGSS